MRDYIIAGSKHLSFSKKQSELKFWSLDSYCDIQIYLLFPYQQTTPQYIVLAHWPKKNTLGVHFVMQFPAPSDRPGERRAPS